MSSNDGLGNDGPATSAGHRARGAFSVPEDAEVFVKAARDQLVHTDMLAIAEIHDVLRCSYALTASATADLFELWQQGDLASYLIDASAQVLRRKVSGEEGVVTMLQFERHRPSYSQGVASDRHPLFAGRALGRACPAAWPFDRMAADDLRDALLATRIMALAQTFDRLAIASDRQGWALDPAAIAAMWRGSGAVCGRLIDQVVHARATSPLLSAPYFDRTVRDAHPGWRRVVVLAVAGGVPTPVIAAALADYDARRRRSAPADLLTALREQVGPLSVNEEPPNRFENKFEV